MKFFGQFLVAVAATATVSANTVPRAWSDFGSLSACRRPSSSATSLSSVGTSSILPTISQPSACPLGTLSGNFLTPDLMTHVSAARPDTSIGANVTQHLYTPGDLGTISNFYIPAEYANKTCSIVFYYPTGLRNRGPGNFHFRDFAYPASTETTFATLPPTYIDLGSFNLKPGDKYTLGQLPCPAGVMTSGIITSNDTQLIFKQKTTPCPAGLFVVTD